MVLQELLTIGEIDIIFDALQKRQTFWKTIAMRPIQGYGKATEVAKKEQARIKADQISDLMSKLVEITI